MIKRSPRPAFVLFRAACKWQHIGKSNASIPRDPISFRLELCPFPFDSAKEAFCDNKDDSPSWTVSLKEEAETEKHRLEFVEEIHLNHGFLGVKARFPDIIHHNFKKHQEKITDIYTWHLLLFVWLLPFFFLGFFRIFFSAFGRKVGEVSALLNQVQSHLDSIPVPRSAWVGGSKVMLSRKKVGGVK